MKDIKIFIVGLVAMFFITACSNSSSNFNTKNGTLSVSVLDEIKKYYVTKFNNSFNLEVVETDTFLELNFTSKTNLGEILGSAIFIAIPKKNLLGENGTNSIVSGDLNNDNLDDLVICVSSEGENGSAVLPDPSKIFVFLNSANGFVLGDITDADNLNGNQPGFYSLVEIKQGKLVGQSCLWGENDSESNPTKIYTSVSKFEDNKLVYESKKFLKNGKKAWE